MLSQKYGFFSEFAVNYNFYVKQIDEYNVCNFKLDEDSFAQRVPLNIVPCRRVS